MVIRIYNTLSRTKEEFIPLKENEVSIYVCGPTVYDKAHIGHAMSSVIFDVIHRYLEFRGYKVFFVMNFTDVDDKIINRANKENIDPIFLAEGYIEEYMQHLEDLNVLPADLYPRATREIDNIITMVSDLIEKGNAYEADGDVYFFVTSFDDYGKLSGRRIEDMMPGSRIQVNDKKETPMDFALWKSTKPGEPYWESPWGKGRPGWHIECSAMNLYHLGEQIDIHGGGNDLIFPHHENEIAQTEALTGKPFSRYWVHNGMLQFSGEKMSKSLGNLITIEEFLSMYDSDSFRLMILNSSYRSPLTFNDEVIGHAKSALKRLKSALRPARYQSGKGDSDKLKEQMLITRDGFINNMDDDFNTAGAMGLIFDFVRTINQARDEGAGEDSLLPAQTLLKELTSILGLQLEESPAKIEKSAAIIDLLISVRDELRKNKQWALSDKIRDNLADLGVVIEDSPDRSQWYLE